MPPALAVLVCVNSRNQVNWSYAGLVSVGVALWLL